MGGKEGTFLAKATRPDLLIRGRNSHGNRSLETAHTVPKDRSSAVSLDIVIPVYNEEGMIGPLFDRLTAVFAP